MTGWIAMRRLIRWLFPKRRLFDPTCAQDWFYHDDAPEVPAEFRGLGDAFEQRDRNKR